MSLLDVINNRISELQSATDAKYKAAGYEIPTASQRKAAEYQGINPYEYATQLKQVETAQKEAEKAAKKAARAASKSSSSSGRSSSSSLDSSGSYSSAGYEDSGSSSGLWSSMFNGEDSDSEEIPSIKSMQQLQQESFQRKKARRRAKGAEKQLENYREQKKEEAKQAWNASKPKPMAKKEERTTETPSVLAAQQGNLGDDFLREQEEVRQEEELREQIPSLPENLFAQGTMEGNLYDIRNAEMADMKAQADAQEQAVQELEDYRQTLKEGGLDLDKLAKDSGLTPQQYMEKNKAQSEKMSTIYSHQGMTMTDSDLDKFLDTNYQLDVFEQEAAQTYIDQYKKDHENYSKITSDMDDLSSTAFLAPWTDVAAERQKILDKYGITYNEYRNIEDIHTLEQKISNLSAFGEGFGSITRNLYGALTDFTDDAGRWLVENTPDFLQFGEPKTEEEKRAAKLVQGHKDLERNVLMNKRDALKSSLQTQSPLAYGSGKAVEQVLLTAASNGILNGSGLVGKVAGMAGGGPLAKALTEIGLDTALVDIPTDTIPEMIENYNNGMPIDQVLANAGINVAINAAINAGVDVGLPAAVKALNGGSATKAAQAKEISPLLDQTDDVIKQMPDNVTNNILLDDYKLRLANANTADEIEAIYREAVENGLDQNSIQELLDVANPKGIDELNTLRAADNSTTQLTEDNLTDYFGDQQRSAVQAVNNYTNDMLLDDYKIRIANANTADEVEAIYKEAASNGLDATSTNELADIARAKYLEVYNPATAPTAPSARQLTENDLNDYFGYQQKPATIKSLDDFNYDWDQYINGKYGPLDQFTPEIPNVTGIEASTIRPGSHLIDPSTGIKISDSINGYADDMQKALSNWGARHSDLLNDQNIKASYDQLSQAIDDYRNAALYSDGNINPFYTNVDNARKDLINVVKNVDSAAASDKILTQKFGSNESLIKSADQLRSTVDNIDNVVKATGNDNTIKSISDYADNTPKNIPEDVRVEEARRNADRIFNREGGAELEISGNDASIKEARDMLAPIFNGEVKDPEQIKSILDSVNKKVKESNSEDIIKSITENPEIPKNTGNIATPAQIPPESAKTVSPTETPAATPKAATGNPAAPSGPDMRQRGYDKTYQSGRTNIQEGLKTEPEMYEVRHNADTQARADKIFNEAKSLNDVETQARSLISEGDATAVPLTSKLINEYAKSGDTNKAVDLLNALEEKMTKSGQFTQAAKMTIVQNNPDVAMVYLQRQLDKMNAAGKTKFKNKWNNFKLTDDELAAFKNIAPGDVDGISAIYEQIGTRLGKEMPATGIDKLNEYRKLAMLLNPRTHIRNVGANMIMLPVREATDRVSAIGQRAYKLINNDYEVTQSILPPSPADRKLAGNIYDSSIKQRLEGFASAKYAESATGMDAFNKAFNENRQIFRDSKLGTLTNDVLKSDTSILNKISGGKIAQAIEDGKITGSMLENLRRFDYYLLGEVEDNPFVKANFTSRLGSYIRAQGIKDISDIPNDIVEVAYQEALKATFKDDNVISDMIGGLRNSLNKYSGGVLGDALFPFTKTPSAIAARGIDYSPAGFASSIYHYLKSDRSNLAVSNLFDDLSKATTGTMAIGLGIALAKAGVITGPLSDNKKEKQFQQSQGQQAYSIKIGDRYYSYDWAQPAAIPMILGATIYNAMEADNEDLKQALTNPQTYWNSTKAATNAWIDLSPLKTFADLFGSGDYAGSFAEGVKDAAVSYATSYIPSVMGATARATDNNYRTTYDKSNMFGSALNQAIAKIPGLSKTLPASYDMWGNERTRADNGLESAFAQFVNPGQLSHNNTTPIDEEVGRIGAYPNKAEWSVDLDDGSKKLTNEEYANLQREMGQQSYEYANEFITNNVYYSDLNDENKKEVLSKLYNLAKAQTESDLFGKEIKEGTTNYKLNQIYEAEGTEGVVNYLARNMAINQAGADATDTTIKLYEEGITVGGTTLTGTDAIELYVEARDWCKANGITNNENNRAAYYAEHINDPRPQKSAAPAEQTEASVGMATETPKESVPTTSNTVTGAIPGLLGNPELAEAQQTINDYKQMMRDYTGFGKQPESSIPSIADTSNMSETDKLLLKQEQTAIMEQYGLDYSKDNAKLLDKYGETALEAKAILSDADYSFGDNEKKLYKDGGVEAVRNYVETRTSLEDAGLDTSYKIYDSYLHALENYPGMTPTQYANAVKSIDQNDNSEISQKEILAYIQANGLTVEQAEELCRVLGNWTTTPYITKKGTWAMH